MAVLFFYLATVSRYYSYLASACRLLKEYEGAEPFPSFQKKFFSQNKKYGSKDRKLISHLCYCFFRLGKAAPLPPKGEIGEESVNIEEKILIGLFLCSTKPNEILEALKPEWNEKIGSPLKEKLLIINYSLLIKDVFPWQNELSSGIDHEKFCNSFFLQPDLFVRIRPGHAETVLLKLAELAIDFEFISPFTIRLPNSYKADQHFEPDKEIVIQDYNSQQLANFLPVDHGKKPEVWDCCAGSGGKSIMAYDLNPDIELTVSDIRESILANLKKRFQKAGIKKYKIRTTDLTSDADACGQHPDIYRRDSRLPTNDYDLIIADVPCTGSGTWSRTPEQLYFFDQQKIKQFSHMQKQIVSNAIPHLLPGGYFIYITCSVFKKENEDVVDFIKNQFRLQLKQMELLKGYDKRADSLFVAVFRNAE